MAWLFTGEAAGMAMRVLVMAILARVLSPGDFGLFGAAMIFISFSDMLVTTGLRPVIIQVKELSNHHISTANSLSIIINIIVGTSIFALSGIISDLMKMDSLPLLLKTLSFAFPCPPHEQKIKKNRNKGSTFFISEMTFLGITKIRFLVHLNLN